VIAAVDVSVHAIDAHAGLSHQASLLADLDGPDGLAALTAVERVAEPASCTVPTSGPSPGLEQGLSELVSAQGPPASRFVAEGQANDTAGVGPLVTAPPGLGSTATAFAAFAGTVAQGTPSALAASASRPLTGAATVNRTRLMNSMGRTGLSFERNMGQTASRVDYLAHTGSATVFLTPTAAVFAMQKAPSGAPSVAPSTVVGMPNPQLATADSNGGVAVYMDLVGANPAAQPQGQGELPGKVNYYLGNDAAKWHSNIPTFGRASKTTGATRLARVKYSTGNVVEANTDACMTISAPDL
jgi:hypothetical protein